MIRDMAMRGLREETQRDYLRVVSGFAGFLGRARDTTTVEDIRRFLGGVTIGADRAPPKTIHL